MASFLKSLRGFRVGRLIPEKYKTLPEKWKGGRVEKWAFYWKGIYADYREVGREAVIDLKTKRLKATGIFSGLGLSYVAYKTNPTEQMFEEQMLEKNNLIGLIGTSIRNPESERHMSFLMKCYNEGLYRFVDLIFFSIIWINDYDKSVSLYAAQCGYLKPRYLKFYERIVDVGAFGSWINMEVKMIDYDLNPNEWLSTQVR